MDKLNRIVIDWVWMRVSSSPWIYDFSWNEVLQWMRFIPIKGIASAKHIELE